LGQHYERNYMWNVQDVNAMSYMSVVDDALIYDDVFKEFKQNRYYSAIVGGQSDEDGAKWFIERIKNNDPVDSKIETFKKNDTIGDPALYDSKEYGLIASSTLRYINSLLTIQEHLGDLNGKDIVEVGVGFGGLCYVLSSYYDLKSYRLVDLPNATLLALKCLAKLDVDNLVIERSHQEVNLKYEERGKTAGDFRGKFDTEKWPVSIIENRRKNNRDFQINFNHPKFDLLISEYCITEMDDAGIDSFYEKYIQHSENIYIFSNLWDKKRKEAFLSRLDEKFKLIVFDDPMPQEIKICPEPEKMNQVIIGKKR